MLKLILHQSFFFRTDQKRSSCPVGEGEEDKRLGGEKEVGKEEKEEKDIEKNREREQGKEISEEKNREEEKEKSESEDREEREEAGESESWLELSMAEMELLQMMEEANR